MSWLKERSTEETLVILKTLSATCADLGGPVTEYLNNLVQADRFDVLLDFNPSYDDIEIEDAVYARQVLGLFSKFPFLPLSGVSPRETAVKRFVQSERICLEANRTINRHRAKPYKTAPHVTHILLVASQKIMSILGPVPSLEDLQFAFGPGANTNVKGAVAMPRAKLSASLECSNKFSPTVAAFLEEVPLWTRSHSTLETEDSFVVPVNIVPGKLMFVPKNAKTDRAIVVEPILNSFCQKGVGAYIRERLGYSGINLRDQSRNQKLALHGSTIKCGETSATLDFSMASDCIAVEAVHLLLPPVWADFLSQLRTDTVTLSQGDIAIAESELGFELPDGVMRLEKFSSMGNGFTFELETLIFYGIALACKDVVDPLTSGDISVYGDDVVLPSSIAAVFEEVCNFVGFSLNREKSYTEGPFRESCGADYLSGFDIRPFYQKSLISDRTLFTMYNWFIRHGEPLLAAKVDEFITPSVRIYGPDGYGDGHLIGAFPNTLPRKYRRLGYSGSIFETYSLNPRRITTPMFGDSVLPSYSVYTRSGQRDKTDPNVTRGSRGYSKVSIYTLKTSIF